MERRFHFPFAVIIALIAGLMLIFFFIGIGEKKTSTESERVDIMLYDKLGVDLRENQATLIKELSAKDEIIDMGSARNTIAERFDDLEQTDAVIGVHKTARVYEITGKDKGKRTLVELFFKIEHPISKVILIEQIPAEIDMGKIELTQTGQKTENMIRFTFNNPHEEQLLSTAYVILDEVDDLDTTIFAAQEKDAEKQTTNNKGICGDGQCVEGESYISCCTDCGCLPGFGCVNNACKSLKTHECMKDGDCDDHDTSTKDTCEGSPRKCKNTAIEDCIPGDSYCPISCGYLNDTDCEPYDEEREASMIPEVNISDLNISGEQESPKILNVTLEKQEMMIGDNLVVKAHVTDANGKEDIAKVWFEVLELADTHDEIQTMYDRGTKGDVVPDDDTYTAERQIREHYLTGNYHLTVFAQDHHGNKKKSQIMFRIIPAENSTT